MKKLIATIIAVLLGIALPLVAYATPVSWDFASGVLQPLQSAWSATVKGDHFVATSTANPSIFPYASTTALSVSSLTPGNCLQAGTGGLVTSIASPCSTGSSGAGTVSTSSQETATFVPFWTSTNGTPALLSGGTTNFVWDNSNNILKVLHLLSNSSSTLQNFTAVNSTSTSATTTNLFSTTASSTNLYGQLINGFGLSSCSGTNALTWASGSFSCSAQPQGTVTAVSVASANGFAGSSSGGATPALTLSTTISGVLKGNGTAISAAANGTDYTLITAKTCSAGDFVSSVTAAGVFTCTTPAGTTYTGTFPISVTGSVISFGGLTTSTNLTIGQVPYVTGVNTFGQVATSSIASGSGITVTNGSTAYVLGAQPSVACNTANTSTFGCLTSTDWNTFNGKQAAGSYITALTGDVTAAGPGSSAATLATVNSNVGSFTNANITVNAKGLVTAASNGTGSFGKAWEIDGSGWLAPTTSIGVSLKSSGATYGLGWDDALLGYASSTNRSTIFGLGAGGQAATTTDIGVAHLLVTAFGYRALNANTARGNDAFGGNALLANTTGTANSAFGGFSANANTTGLGNVAIGNASLLLNTTGSNNTAVGSAAGPEFATSTNDSTFIGPCSGANINTDHGTSDRNTAIGSGAMGASCGLAASTRTAQNNNVAIGYNAIGNIGDSQANDTAIGYQAGFALVKATENILIGAQPNTGGTELTSGGGNIGIGYNTRFASASTNLGLNIGGLLFGTLPATTSATSLQIPTSGLFGVASTSPYATLSVHANNGSTNTTLFAIGSSTASATTTLFMIDNVGSTTLGRFGTCGGTNALTTNSAGTIICGPLNGFVTAVSVASANGFAGSSSGGATPALTLSTTITGLLKGNGTAISAAAYTDFPTIAANTILGNVTGATAAPTALATSSQLFTGTTGQIAYFNGINSLFGTSSVFVATNNNVGVGSSTPWARLSVSTTAQGSPLSSLFSVASTTNDGIFHIFGGGITAIGTSSPWGGGLVVDRNAAVASSSIISTEYRYGKSGNLATSTSQTIDCRLANTIHWPLGASATTLTISGMVPGQVCTVILENPNQTAGAITFAAGTGSILLWANGTVPTQTTTSNKMDVYSFKYTQGSTTNALLGAQTPSF